MTLALTGIILGFQAVGFALGFVAGQGRERAAHRRRDPGLIIERHGRRVMAAPLSHLALLADLENEPQLILVGPTAVDFGVCPEDPTLRVYLTKAETR